jgi:Flp pilus assembly CpaF family ATPase
VPNCVDDVGEAEEVWTNVTGVRGRNGRQELTNMMLSREQVDELVVRMLKSSGHRIDLSQPFVDARRPVAALARSAHGNHRARVLRAGNRRRCRRHRPVQPAFD